MASNNKFYIKHGERPWENPEVLHTFRDQWTIVRVQTPWDYCLETWYLDHCLGSKHFETFELGHRVFSLRDTYGIPHATILGILPDITSPYMGCSDLLTTDFFNIGGENLRILQVRGREDDLATRESLFKVCEWLQMAMPKTLLHQTALFGDTDMDYHVRSLLPAEHTWNEWTPASKAPHHEGLEKGWLSF